MSAMLSSGFVGVSTQTSVRAARLDRGAHRVDVVQRHGGVVDAPALEHARDQPVGAAVRVVRDDDVAAGRAERAQHGVLGGHAGGEREPAAAALERGDGLLERAPRRVGGAAVLVAAAQPADAVLLVRRDLVDRRRDGARLRVGVVAGVHDAGCRGAAARPAVRSSRHASHRRRLGAASISGASAVVSVGRAAAGAVEASARRSRASPASTLNVEIDSRMRVATSASSSDGGGGLRRTGGHLTRGLRDTGHRDHDLGRRGALLLGGDRDLVRDGRGLVDLVDDAVEERDGGLGELGALAGLADALLAGTHA